MNLDPIHNQKETAARFARQSINAAKLLLGQGNVCGFAREMESAICWAVECWLWKQGHRPDNRNGWSSMLLQFTQYAPHELSGAVLSPYSSAQSLATYDERGSRPDNETLAGLGEWCDRVAAVVETLIGAL